MADYTITLDADPRQALQAFKQVEQEARKSGESAGKQLAEGLQGFSSKSVAALQQELQRLTQRQLKVDVDSRAFTVAGQQIKAVQAQIDAIQRKQVAIGVDSRSIQGLQARLQELQARQVRVNVDSQEFTDLQRQINATQAELTAIERKKITINVSANSITALTDKLQADLERLQQRRLKIDVDSQEFKALGVEIDRVQNELQQVERKRTQVNVDDRSVVALQTRLQDLQQRQTKVSVDSSEFRSLQREIDGLQGELKTIERQRVTINVDANSVTAITTKLQAELERLQQRQLKINVDSAEFAALGRQIDQVQTELTQLERKRVMVNVDANSITALNAKLGDLQQELNRVAIGSQRFRELQSAIESTERELAKAGESTDKFRLLDGVIQGVAFSLSNAVVSGAGQALNALQGLISGYARLDTIIRQAAAADGGANAYGKLAATIDKVGIDAAGTQEQVAQLSLELARGGITADQQAESLMGIVRGAEATATAYDQMGQIVSAALTSFGLAASETNRVVDALVQGANASATDVTGLGEAFKIAAPAAKLLGISVEGLSTAVGLFTNAGVTASEAGTALRNGLSQLGSAAPQTGGAMQKLTGQAKDAADVMKVLKLDIYNANGTLKPMETVLLQLKAAFDKLGPAARIQLASKLFGGTDDGTKWLAVLGQSEEKIRAMAKAMDNAKGSTDRNRDAMQGFQLTLNQLTGTLNSIGNSIGKIAAAALLPLIQAANTVVGAVAALPGPVKDTAIALGLLTGAVVTATTAYVVFQRVLQANITQQAIAGVVDLGRAIGATLAAGVSSAAAAIPGLLAQLQLLGQVKVGAALSAIGTALRSGFIAGIEGAKAAVVSLVSILNSASFAQFIAGARAALVALAPVALAVGAVTAAVVVWQKVLEGANQASDEFANSQKVTGEALIKLGGDLNKVAQDAKNANQGFLGLGEIFRNAKEGWTLIRLVQETEKLDKGFNQVYGSAMKFAQELRNTNNITDEQKKKAQEYIAQLQAISNAYRAQAERAKALAISEAQLGNKDTANYYQSLAVKLGANAGSMDRLVMSFQKSIGVQTAATAATNQQTGAIVDQEKAVKDRIAAEAELNKLIAEAPVRGLDAQIAVGQQLLFLAQAIGQAEQSRFAVSRSALEFELQQAEKRGASESQIGSIKKQIAEADRQALQARLDALVNEQTLQRALLELSQQKARTEANLEVTRQKVQLLELESKITEAKNKGDQRAVDSLVAQYNLQNEILGIKQGQVDLLDQTQPLERSILGLQMETATNGLRAEAAAKGYAIALDGTLRPASAMVELQGKISTVTKASAEDQRRYADLARQSGLAIGTARDGTLVLGRTQQDVNKAVAEMNRQIGGAASGFNASTKSAGQTKGAVDGIRTGLANAANPANALAGAFTRTGDKAPAIAQGSRDFAAYLSKAGGFGVNIANLNLDRRMGTVASETGRAATAAQAFYNYLKQAAALPGSRWTGGPVEAGAEYRINELGQEAFLSAGRLSLIDAAPNSIWRAPSDGVVIPAGITARLQATAAVQASGGGSAGVAELAIEVGKLRQEVGNLARRDWSVHVTQRTGPTGSQVMRTLLS